MAGVKGPARPGIVDRFIASSLNNGVLGKIVKRSLRVSGSGQIGLAIGPNLNILDLHNNLQMTSDSPIELRIQHLSRTKDILFSQSHMVEPAELELKIVKDIIPSMFADKKIVFSKFLGLSEEDFDISVHPANLKKSVLNRILSNDILQVNEMEIIKRAVASKGVEVLKGEEDLLAIPIADGDNFHGIVLLSGRVNDNDILIAKDFSRTASICLKNAVEFKIADKKARTDLKLGIPNYTEWFEALQTEIERVKRTYSNVSVVIFDLDHFKKVNDEYGHLVGDEVLKRFAKLITDCKRRYDTAGRYGGEELALTLPETSKADAARVAERIRREFAKIEFCSLDGKTKFTVTVSAGVADYWEDVAKKGDDIVEKADECMYWAKRNGRNRVACEINGELTAEIEV